MKPWPYPAPVDDGGAVGLTPGTCLPPIGLDGTDGRRIDMPAVPGVSVIFVYPWTGRAGLPNPPAWDDIPGAHGSTPEAEGFRDLHVEFTEHGCRIFGLSSQDSAHQRELALRLALPYALLSDADFRFAEMMGLPRFETGGVTYLKRLTIVARDGAIEKVFYPVHPPDRHAGEVLTWLRAHEMVAPRVP